jgi:uncharacterized protein YbcI
VTFRRDETGQARHDPPTGGRLGAAIVNAIVRIHRRYSGHGPSKAQVFFRHNFVVVVMQDVRTRAEETLAARGDGEAALCARRALYATMRGPLVSAVEDLTGTHVLAFMSDSELEPDVATHVYVLDRPVDDQETFRN